MFVCFVLFCFVLFCFVSRILLNISVICLTDSSPSIMPSLVRLSMPQLLVFVFWVFFYFKVFLTSDVMISGTSNKFELV